jgi:hypothetical protein
MSVLDLIHKHDPQVHLLWEMRCDCAGDRNPRIGAVYAHGEDWHLYIPPLKGRHAATGVTVKRAAKERRLESGTALAEVVECSRCHSHFVLSSAPLASAYLVIRMGVPPEDPIAENEHVTTLQVPFDAAALQVMPGLFLTPLGKSTHARVAP